MPSSAMQSYSYVTEVRNLLRLNTQLENITSFYHNVHITMLTLNIIYMKYGTEVHLHTLCMLV